jgi:hypothetical protein
MRWSVALAKDMDAKKESSPTSSSEESIYHVQHEPDRQLGSIGDVIGNVRHDGGRHQLTA